MWKEQVVTLPSDRDRWLFAFERRHALLRVALRYARTPADAEDAVATAIERAARAPVAEEPRLYGWLARVTINACHEQRRREATPRLLARLQAEPLIDHDPAERVCDRAAATWLAAHASLTPAQREALGLLAQGRSIGEIAATMRLTYKAVESLLGRARAAIRRTQQAALGLAGPFWRWSKQHVRGAAALAVTVPFLFGAPQPAESRRDYAVEAVGTQASQHTDHPVMKSRRHVTARIAVAFPPARRTAPTGEARWNPARGPNVGSLVGIDPPVHILVIDGSQSRDDGRPLADGLARLRNPVADPPVIGG